MNLDRTRITGALFDALDAVDEVVSVSVVGSICDRDSIDVISDIDTIVIVDALNEANFQACIAAVNALSGEQLGLPGKQIHINSTFGPLKFDTADQVVIHLMIYDVAGHRTHVLKSPFTCLDWERSTCYRGKSLREVYPVLRLSVDHFLHARRGTEDYIRDLEAGALSFREYEFDAGEVVEVTRSQSLDTRLKGEYAYHIVKNLLQNYAKFVRSENRAYTWPELCDFWRKYLPTRADLIPFFNELYAAKQSGEKRFPASAADQAKTFLESFFADLRAEWDAAPTLTWVRHARTSLNDGTFLGQGRDPGVVEDQGIDPLEQTFDRVYASPSRRATETATRLSGGTKPEVVSEVHEINYGEAEGLLFADALRILPELPVAWAAGQDPVFPGGENSELVITRVQAFLERLASQPPQHGLVVSHNVTTRCLIGSLCRLPMAQWFRLPIDHLDAFELRLIDGRWVLNLSAHQRENLTDALIDD